MTEWKNTEFISRDRSLKDLTYWTRCFLFRTYSFFLSSFYFPCQAFVFLLFCDDLFIAFPGIAPCHSDPNQPFDLFSPVWKLRERRRILHTEFFAIYPAASIKIVALFAFHVNIRFFMENRRTFPPCSRAITEIAHRNWTQDYVDRGEKWRNERLADFNRFGHIWPSD